MLNPRVVIAISLALAACGSDDKKATWSTLLEGQGAALLSAWGSSANDIWVTGGDDGMGPMLFHYEGTNWNRVDTGERMIDLWWSFGFPGGPVFFAGSNGTILKKQGETIEKMTTPGNAIVFGMWGSAPDDVWAVGGRKVGGGFAWHYDGSTWTAMEVPMTIVDEGTIWKVSGRSKNDVWMSCTNATALHWNGTALEEVKVDPMLDGSLFSVATDGTRFYMVGGFDAGVIYENEGAGWSNKLRGGELFSGVASSATDAFAVGRFGSVVRRGGGSWAVEPTSTDQNLHAAWIDPDGVVYAVGGDFDAQPTKSGVLVKRTLQ